MDQSIHRKFQRGAGTEPAEADGLSGNRIEQRNQQCGGFPAAARDDQKLRRLCRPRCAGNRCVDHLAAFGGNGCERADMRGAHRSHFDENPRTRTGEQPIGAEMRGLGGGGVGHVRTSDGCFVDATIHDIDLMCWIAGERPVEVVSHGSCMFDPAIGAEGDFDLAMTQMKMPSGAIVHINNSRACAYGFDQRVEAFGDEGMLQTVNHRDDPLIRWSSALTEARKPLKHFFLERYDRSFFRALDEFHTAIAEGRAPSATQADGRAALAIALACAESARTGTAVVPSY